MARADVVTRFAPSPTGALHVGGARTALFNWAFARQHGGEFIIRIEDTDRARSSDASTGAMLADLRWLGLDWDQGPDPTAADPTRSEIGDRGPYVQSKRLEIYRRHVDQLLASDLAYKSFETRQELAAHRERVGPIKDFSSILSAEQANEREVARQPHVVRLRAPQHVAFDDLVYGRIEVAGEDLEDYVILKSDGYPTYHLAVVVDDCLMGVTHVIRGQEHLTNTAKHVALQEALGIDRPVFVHTPSIINADGSKMSKREKAKVARAAAKSHLAPLTEQGRQQWLQQLSHMDKLPTDQLGVSQQSHRQVFQNVDHLIEVGHISSFLEKKNDEPAIAHLLAADLNIDLPEIDVQDFRFAGYLPGPLLNYIALLGWSPGDDVERFGPRPLSFIKDHFSLDRINKSNARFDREKLFRFNAEAIASLPFDAFRPMLFEHGKPHFHGIFESPDDPRFALYAQAYQPRARTLSEPQQIGAFFLIGDEQLDYDAKAVKKVLAKGDGRGYKVLEQIQGYLESLEPWEASAIEQAVETFARQQDLGMKDVAQPLRVAVSGGTVSPPIGQTLAILGKTSTIARLRRCIKLAPHGVGS